MHSVTDRRQTDDRMMPIADRTVRTVLQYDRLKTEASETVTDRWGPRIFRYSTVHVCHSLLVSQFAVPVYRFLKALGSSYQCPHCESVPQLYQI